MAHCLGPGADFICTAGMNTPRIILQKNQDLTHLLDANIFSRSNPVSYIYYLHFSLLSQEVVLGSFSTSAFDC